MFTAHLDRSPCTEPAQSGLEACRDVNEWMISARLLAAKSFRGPLPPNLGKPTPSVMFQAAFAREDVQYALFATSIYKN